MDSPMSPWRLAQPSWRQLGRSQKYPWIVRPSPLPPPPAQPRPLLGPRPYVPGGPPKLKKPMVTLPGQPPPGSSFGASSPLGPSIHLRPSQPCASSATWVEASLPHLPVSQVGRNDANKILKSETSQGAGGRGVCQEAGIPGRERTTTPIRLRGRRRPQPLSPR